MMVPWKSGQIVINLILKNQIVILLINIHENTVDIIGTLMISYYNDYLQRRYF